MGKKDRAVEKVELGPAVVLNEQDYVAASLRKARKKEARKMGR